LKNKSFVLGLGFSVHDVIMVACLRDFMAEVTWPWALTQGAISLAHVFVESRLSSKSLEPLVF